MNSVLLEAELPRDKGVRYDRYLDTFRRPTTGIGHNLDTSPLPMAALIPGLTRTSTACYYREL
jgi:hypothetical protein